MGRVINTDSAGKERTRLTRGVALAIRELARQAGPGAEARDLAAFIALALEAIAGTIESSVAAWEKRDYWVKADRFRMEWEWAGTLGNRFRAALLADDWAQVALLAAQAAQRLRKIQVSENHRLGCPWAGAWEELKSRQG
ncbi:MAG: hypothetical protein FJZ96_13560 [Chloroflexi bacterium]|nr:hypothetical protein [Chloroflexota bacterium]